MRRRSAIALLAAVLAGTTAVTYARGVHDAVSAGELICEFTAVYRHTLIDELSGEMPPVDLLLVYEAVTEASAQVLSTRRPGRRDVAVRTTGRAVHLIEPVGASVRVTRLSGCENTRWKNGVERCVRFTAQHAWHFDTRSSRDPDDSFERVPSGAAPGVCEPWTID